MSSTCPVVSIVTAYHDRKPQFLRTLLSIQASRIEDIELIVVDDGSSDEHRLEDLIDGVRFSMRVIRLEPNDKWYCNPCIPFNVGIREARGTILVLQNPECLHAGDVLAHAATHLGNDDYFSYGCYSLDRERTERLDDIGLDCDDVLAAIADRVLPLPQRAVEADGTLGWYNHSRFRPSGYHFLAATLRRHMTDLNGFDERYAKGYGYDDNELLVRIQRKGLTVGIVDEPAVLHQWHYSSVAFLDNARQRGIPLQDNFKLFREVTLRETTYRAGNVDSRFTSEPTG